MSKSEVTFRLPLSQPTQRPDIRLARIRTPGHLTLQTFGHQKLSHSDSNYSTRSSVFGEIELVVFKCAWIVAKWRLDPNLPLFISET